MNKTSKSKTDLRDLYSCPFCGKMIEKEDILFVDDSFDQSYQDKLRFDFLMNCSRVYPLDDMDNFRGLYHQPNEENIINRDVNGYPNVLQVHPSEGLTPGELLQLANGKELTSPSVEVKPEASTEAQALATRACPHCHCSLPNKFGVWPTISVTMLGGRASGKTVYLIALLQQLQSQLTINNLGSINILRESERFMRPQIEYYVENQGVSMPTPTERLFPLVIEYSNLDSSCFIAIYDIAGEGIVNQQQQPNANYLVNHRGVQKANFVWLVLDPNQLNNGAFGSAPDGETVSNDHDMFTMPIDNFLAQAIKSTSHLGILQQVKDVIAIITKIDLPLTSEPSLFAGRVLIKDDIGKSHHNRVNNEVLHQVDQNVNTYITHKLGHRDAREMIQSNFRQSDASVPNVHMMAVSAYTKTIRTDGLSPFSFQNHYHAESSKHRIIEPFLKLLVLTGVAPKLPEPKEPIVQKRRRGLFGRRRA